MVNAIECVWTKEQARSWLHFFSQRCEDINETYNILSKASGD